MKKTRAKEVNNSNCNKENWTCGYDFGNLLYPHDLHFENESQIFEYLLKRAQSKKEENNKIYYSIKRTKIK